MDHELDRRVHSVGAAEAARAMGPDRRLGVEVAERPGVTVRTTTSGIELDAGTDGADLVVALAAGALDDLMAERMSVFGLLYDGRLGLARGGIDELARWEPALQALLYDRPVYGAADAGAFDVEELHRSFALGDDPFEMASFLDRAGFLHVRRVFEPSEVAALSAEVDRLRASARPDDGRSWWATGPDGEDRCCRLTFMGERSSVLAALADDPRLALLASLSGHDVDPAPTRNDGISAVLKNPAGTSGLSDLPWHRDCGLGGHPLLCPGVATGIQLDRADAANGQLVFLPGSQRHAGPVGDPAAHGYPTVAVEADPGDVTVHVGHVLHAAPPPTAPDASRRAIYVGFAKRELFEQIPEGYAYNDVVYSGGDGHVRNVAERSAS